MSGMRVRGLARLARLTGVGRLGGLGLDDEVRGVLGASRLGAAAAAAGFSAAGFLAEGGLLLAAAGELAIESVRRGQRGADAGEVAGLHVGLEVLLHAPAAGVVGKRYQGAVLVGVQVGRIGQRAHATLVLSYVGLEEGGTLRAGNGGVQGGAAAALDAVVAETWGVMSVRRMGQWTSKDAPMVWCPLIV